MPSPVPADFGSQAWDHRVVLSAGDFAVIFDQTGDRWTHRLEVGPAALRVDALRGRMRRRSRCTRADNQPRLSGDSSP